MVDLYVEEQTKEELDIDALTLSAKEKLDLSTQELIATKGIDPPPFDPNIWTYMGLYYGETVDSWIKPVPGDWHQQAPYNDSLPLVSGVPPANNGRAFVGCAMIAVTQIMSFHKKAFRDYITTLEWNSMIANSTTSTKLKRLMKDTFYDLKIEDRYNWPDSTGTPSDFGKARTFLRNNGYTVDDNGSGTYSFARVSSVLNYDPAYVSGESTTHAGHGWVVDGVKTVTWNWYEFWTITHINTLFEHKVPVSNGIFKYVQYYWGWGSGYHTWFADGVFAVTHPYLGPLNFDWCITIIGPIY